MRQLTTHAPHCKRAAAKASLHLPTEFQTCPSRQSRGHNHHRLQCSSHPSGERVDSSGPGGGCALRWNRQRSHTLPWRPFSFFCFFFSCSLLSFSLFFSLSSLSFFPLSLFPCFLVSLFFFLLFFLFVVFLPFFFSHFFIFFSIFPSFLFFLFTFSANSLRCLWCFLPPLMKLHDFVTEPFNLVHIFRDAHTVPSV